MAKFAREIVLAGVLLSCGPAWSQAPANAQPPVAAASQPPAIPVNGKLVYRGFAVDATEVRGVPRYNAIMTSIVHQIDIVADCGAKPEILQFFRSQTVFVKHAPPGGGSGGGHFNSNSPGITLSDTVAEPQKPILLHELLHAYHFRVMPGAFRNSEVLTYFNRAHNIGAYQADAYVLKNAQEFFAVTASLYLWGNVDRPPATRANLKAAQPVYYAWLGRQFGVVK
jgi:hypothetical protein